MQQVFRTAEQASQYLAEKGIKRSPKTLSKYRCVGGGPSFRYFGRTPLYDDPGLDRWVEEQLSAPKRSTSDAA
jgi:hypothetical protein